MHYEYYFKQVLESPENKTGFKFVGIYGTLVVGAARDEKAEQKLKD